MRQQAQETDVSALLGVRLETGEAAGRAYAAYPNLANVRWLFPAYQPALRRAGIAGLYQPNSLRGRAMRRIIGAGAVPGEKVWLEEENLARLETMLAPLAGVGAVRLAFWPGRRSKARGVPCCGCLGARTCRAQYQRYWALSNGTGARYSSSRWAPRAQAPEGCHLFTCVSARKFFGPSGCS
jgi:hypothetical protein